MDWIVLEGIKPYDGRHELDPTVDFSTREWGWIKRLAGYMPLTVEQGFDGGDPELFAALAVIALHRAGRIETRQAAEVFDRIADAPFGSTIRFDTDQNSDDGAEDDAGPPVSKPTSSGNTSGHGSSLSSASSDAPRNGAGTPGSDSSVSPLVRSAT